MSDMHLTSMNYGTVIEAIDYEHGYFAVYSEPGFQLVRNGYLNDAPQTTPAEPVKPIVQPTLPTPHPLPVDAPLAPAAEAAPTKDELRREMEAVGPLGSPFPGEHEAPQGPGREPLAAERTIPATSSGMWFDEYNNLNGSVFTSADQVLIFVTGDDNSGTSVANRVSRILKTVARPGPCLNVLSDAERSEWYVKMIAAAIALDPSCIWFQGGSWARDVAIQLGLVKMGSKASQKYLTSKIKRYVELNCK